MVFFILTFVDERTCFDDFIDKNYMVFYKNLEDLNYKIHKYKNYDEYKNDGYRCNIRAN